METDIFHLFQSIADRYDNSNTIISMGMHHMWKRHMVRYLAHVLPAHACILDLCCGTGDIASLFLKAGKGFSVVGADFSPNMLKEAEKKLSKLSKNGSYSLKCADAMNLPWGEGTFDCVVISFGLRNTPDQNQVLKEMVRVTKSGGIVCIMDAHYPENIWIRKIFSLYFKWVMPLLGGGRKKRREYQWLDQSVEAFAPWRQLMDMMGRAGLSGRKYKRFLFGSCVYQLGEKSERDTKE